jgi:hypothetical protein
MDSPEAGTQSVDWRSLWTHQQEINQYCNFGKLPAANSYANPT